MRRAWTGPNEGAVKVANTHGWVAIVSGMPLPPVSPARTSWRASRLYTCEQVGQTASRRLPHGSSSTPPGSSAVRVDGPDFAGGQVDRADAALDLDRVVAAAGVVELLLPSRAKSSRMRGPV